MLLSLLNRKEKLKFLDLAIHMVDIDGEPNAIVKKLLDMMLTEVGDIVDEYSFDRSASIEATISFFLDKNNVVKNIVYLNLVKITLVDDLYNTKEHTFLEEIQGKFKITPDKRRDLMQIIYDERDLREKAKRVIKD